MLGQLTTILTIVQRQRKKFYSIEQVPEEESPKEDSESDSMVISIREHSDDYKEPREELLVEYQEEKKTRNPGYTVESRSPTRYCKQKLV
ncbi:hypothetical protein O181_118462 [Austropuccinia psidii MF-1]|uniref:Uncharacterized protein n=1 Tax=Austropuccinia psidii MF-1 TaxID=1389203 RepID=A0A9Q3KFD6_9BASI|nr:hypothetical protein [Austropuccinia psidii MF-1]